MCGGIPDCVLWSQQVLSYSFDATEIALVYTIGVAVVVMDYGFDTANHVLVCHAVDPMQGGSCVESVGGYYVEQRGATGFHVYQETNGCPGLQNGGPSDCVQPDTVVF